MSHFGFNAAQIILASGYPGVTDVGAIPAQVIRLASLPEPVSLVRADQRVNFHLAEKSQDPIRSDTSIYPWIVRTMPMVVESPDHFLQGDKQNTFQLVKRVAPLEKYPSITYIRAIIKFVASSAPARPGPELWISTIVLHSNDSAKSLSKKGTAIGT